MISYAQNFEDIMLWRALRTIVRGLYIDVGANDPQIDSVSLSFHERGWQGVHVEPLPDYARRLRAARVGDLVHQAAVGLNPGEMPFFAVNHSGVSTGLPSQAGVYNNGVNVIETLRVPVMTLAQVLESAPAGDIHWLKIDVEGMEADVLRSWKGSARRPWIVVVESVRPQTAEPNHIQWESLVIEKDYSFAYFDGLNRFYTLNDSPIAADAFACPPCVFDNWSLAGGGTSPFIRHLQTQVAEARRHAGTSDVILQNTKASLTLRENELNELKERLDRAEKNSYYEMSAHQQTKIRLDDALATLERNARLESILGRIIAELAFIKNEFGEMRQQVGAQEKEIVILRAKAINDLADAEEKLALAHQHHGEQKDEYLARIGELTEELNRNLETQKTSATLLEQQSGIIRALEADFSHKLLRHETSFKETLSQLAQALSQVQRLTEEKETVETQVHELSAAQGTLKLQLDSSNQSRKETTHEILALKDGNNILLKRIEQYRDFIENKGRSHHLKCLLSPCSSNPLDFKSGRSTPKLYKNLKKPWHTHLYRASVCVFYRSEKPWHTHIYRAFRSIQGDSKYSQAKSVLVTSYPNDDEVRLRSLINQAIQRGKKRY